MEAVTVSPLPFVLQSMSKAWEYPSDQHSSPVVVIVGLRTCQLSSSSVI